MSNIARAFVNLAYMWSVLLLGYCEHLDACGFHYGLYNFSDLKWHDPLTKDLAIKALLYFLRLLMCLVKSFDVLGHWVSENSHEIL